MSVQLIVFPQTALTNEFVIDGTSFNTINTSSSYDSSATNVIDDTLTNAAPSVSNTWFRFRSTATGTPTLPGEVSGGLTLYSTTTSTLSGVYQKLSNLVIGTTYEIVLNLSTTGTGFVINNIYDARYIEDIPTQMHPDYITTPPQCMPDEYKDDDYVTAYRKYYQGAKSYFAKWERGVSAPDWWVTQ